jgi:catechol 2,3-dioxygenase-like lactoylglutathione lyase family enzyme
MMSMDRLDPGRLESVYVRDPDGNLIEISNYT